MAHNRDSNLELVIVGRRCRAVGRWTRYCVSCMVNLGGGGGGAAVGYCCGGGDCCL